MDSELKLRHSMLGSLGLYTRIFTKKHTEVGISLYGCADEKYNIIASDSWKIPNSKNYLIVIWLFPYFIGTV